MKINEKLKKVRTIQEATINDDGSQTFKIMSYDMIDTYCITMYKKENNLL